MSDPDSLAIWLRGERLGMAERIAGAVEVTATDGLPLDVSGPLRERVARWG